ncbi:MAG: hypothetical protein V3R80_01060, partial [Candidatus Tectomicrobia bacterium]
CTITEPLRNSRYLTDTARPEGHSSHQGVKAFIERWHQSRDPARPSRLLPTRQHRSFRQSRQ